MCEQSVMQQPPTYAELAAATGLSRSYAHEIVNGERIPSQATSIRIYRQTGWKISNIASFSDEDIAVLERALPKRIAA